MVTTKARLIEKLRNMGDDEMVAYNLWGKYDFAAQVICVTNGWDEFSNALHEDNDLTYYKFIEKKYPGLIKDAMDIIGGYDELETDAIHSAIEDALNNYNKLNGINDDDALVIRTEKIGDNNYSIEIVSQKYRNYEFYNGDNYFWATNGVRIGSMFFPEVNVLGDSIFMYVRGKKADEDNKVMIENSANDSHRPISGDTVGKITEAVKEYNIKVRK
jgi:hypothetical protein